MTVERVKLLAGRVTMANGIPGHQAIGSVIEVPADEAKRLVQCGQAEKVEAASKGVAETAAKRR